MKHMMMFFVFVFASTNLTLAQWVRTGPVGGYPFIEALAVKGTNLFAGSDLYGVYLSTDSGVSWSAINSGLTNKSVHALAVSGVTLFAGTGKYTCDNNNNCTFFGDVFRSTDDGATWTAANSGLPTPTPYIKSFAVSGTDLFAGTRDNGLFRSTNNGTSWVQTGLSGYVPTLAVSGTKLFAGAWGGIFRSTDNGANWISINSTYYYHAEVWSLVARGNGANVFFATGLGVISSTDGGTSWFNAGPSNADPFSLASNETSIFLGTQLNNVFRSTDNGTSWTSYSSGLTGVQRLVRCFAFLGSYVFVGTGDGVWRRPLSEFGPHTIATTTSTHGTISPSGGITVNDGDNQSFTVIPDSGYQIFSVYVDGAYVGILENYTFTDVGSNHTITANFISASSPVVSVQPRWNIVSVPSLESDYRKVALFSAANSSAFAFQAGYVQSDTLTNGIGYWLKFGYAQSIAMTGLQITQDTFAVIEGWNLIGSISEPIATSSITSDPGGITTSNFYGYNRGYYVSNYIKPGRGYWVKANQNGKLILTFSQSSSLQKMAANRINIVASSELPPPPPGEIYSKNPFTPTEFSLNQNYPNPFNPSTSISFELAQDAYVTVEVYNMLGQEVAALANKEEFSEGSNQVEFNASHLASGVYYYKIIAEDVEGKGVLYSNVKKMMLLK